MKNREYKIATMIIGVVTALLVVFSQIFQYQEQQQLVKNQKVKTEKQSDSHDDDASYVSQQPSFTVQSSCTVHFSQAAILLFEVCGGEHRPTVIGHEVPRLMGKFFQTLFQILIAPNAP